MVAALYTIGALLALAWLTITLWALLADRSRGRRRCPKCFFSLEGLNAPHCPECGRDITHQRQLHRTRRHLGVAILASALLLPPAALTFGFARVQQVGAWADVPTGVLVRLLWLGDDALTEELGGRIRRGELSRAQAETVVRRASASLRRDALRDHAYGLLQSLARNSYVLTDDRPGALRPMLEELAPDRSMPTLLERLHAGGPAEKAKVLALFSHLRDADERANLEILSRLGHEDPEVAGAARDAVAHSWRASETVKRLPGPPRWLQSFDQAPQTLEAALWLSGEICTRMGDRGAITEWARQVALGKLGPESPAADGQLASACGLWLWCRLEGPSSACWQAVERFAASDRPELRQAAYQQAPLFPWSPSVAALLRRGLADEDWLVQSTAIDSIESFGPEASAMIPDLLAHAAAPRRGGSSAFPEQFAAIGGNARDLLAVLIERLGRARAQQEAPVAADGEPIFLGMDFFWLSHMGLRDEAAAATVRWFVENQKSASPYSNPAAEAAVAYAALTGDKEYPTRALIEMQPDLSQPMYSGSAQGAVLDLMRRRLADDDLLVDHFVRDPATRQPAGFLGLFDFLSRERLADFEVVIRELASDEDPTVSQGAAALLQKLP